MNDLKEKKNESKEKIEDESNDSINYFMSNRKC